MRMWELDSCSFRKLAPYGDLDEYQKTREEAGIATYCLDATQDHHSGHHAGRDQNFCQKRNLSVAWPR